MSADNYYTIKWNKDDHKWYLVHGSMSMLEEGIPATIRQGQPGFDSREEALAELGSHHSEYGLITEPDELRWVVTKGQALEWATEAISVLQSYKKFWEDSDD